MARRKYSRRKTRRKQTLAGKFFKRFTRAILAVVILSAFVLGIAYTVKSVSYISPEKLASIASPYLSKLGMDENEVGQVAGDLIKRATDLGISKDSADGKDTDSSLSGSDSTSTSGNISSASTKRDPFGEVEFSIAIIADSHIANDRDEYKKNKGFLKDAVALANQEGVEALVHVGDITNWGVVSDLKEAKQILGRFEGKFYTLPGDRDLAQSVGPSNFTSVFGDRFHTFTINSVKFVLLDNSANYTLLEDGDLAWFEDGLENADFLILSQPLYTNGLPYPFNCTYMGTTCSEPEGNSLQSKQVEVKAQRNTLLDLIRESDVKAVIAGDHHKSSVVGDPEDSSLDHYVVGSVGGTVSEYSQDILQSQRISLLNIYDSGDYEIVDVTLDELEVEEGAVTEENIEEGLGDTGTEDTTE